MFLWKEKKEIVCFQLFYPLMHLKQIILEMMIPQTLQDYLMQEDILEKIHTIFLYVTGTLKGPDKTKSSKASVIYNLNLTNKSILRTLTLQNGAESLKFLITFTMA